eukprot:7432126-Pyramimonas_sp.AAC.1
MDLTIDNRTHNTRGGLHLQAHTPIQRSSQCARSANVWSHNGGGPVLERVLGYNTADGFTFGHFPTRTCDTRASQFRRGRWEWINGT